MWGINSAAWQQPLYARHRFSCTCVPFRAQEPAGPTRCDTLLVVCSEILSRSDWAMEVMYMKPERGQKPRNPISRANLKAPWMAQPHRSVISRQSQGASLASGAFLAASARATAKAMIASVIAISPSAIGRSKK